MGKNILFLCSLSILNSPLFGRGKTLLPTTQPVFHVDYPSPTADKPQSKLWFGDNCWWAILPRSSEPSLWQCTEKGWTERTEVREFLSGVPGRADVWADEGEVSAIGVGADILEAFRLMKKSNSKGKWKAKKIGSLPLSPDTFTIETATKESDGSEITSCPLPCFPSGLFVAMSNGKPFHYYSLEDLAGNDLKKAGKNYKSKHNNKIK